MKQYIVKSFSNIEIEIYENTHKPLAKVFIDDTFIKPEWFGDEVDIKEIDLILNY